MAIKKKKNKDSGYMTWVRKLDRVISLFVRMRDSKEYNYKYFRCISCGRLLPIEQADCGHYLSRRHMSIRFDTRNTNAECRRCNRYDTDHLVGYRQNLIMRLGRQEYVKAYPNLRLNIDKIKQMGTEQVQQLEILSRQARKWSVFELQEMYACYGRKILEMRNSL